jgi:hypothetical protein
MADPPAETHSRLYAELMYRLLPLVCKHCGFLVVTRLMRPGWLIEIEAVAASKVDKYLAVRVALPEGARASRLETTSLPPPLYFFITPS